MLKICVHNRLFTIFSNQIFAKAAAFARVPLCYCSEIPVAPDGFPLCPVIRQSHGT